FDAGPLQRIRLSHLHTLYISPDARLTAAQRPPRKPSERRSDQSSGPLHSPGAHGKRALERPFPIHKVNQKLRLDRYFSFSLYCNATERPNLSYLFIGYFSQWRLSGRVYLWSILDILDGFSIVLPVSL